MSVFKMKIKDTINNPDLKWWLNYLPVKISKFLLGTNCNLPAHLFNKVKKTEKENLTGKAVNLHWRVKQLCLDCFEYNNIYLEQIKVLTEREN